jgi:hypothetical protein
LQRLTDVPLKLKKVKNVTQIDVDLKWMFSLDSCGFIRSHDRGIKTWRASVSYPQCVFCGNKFRYEVFNAECHTDPDIGKEKIGKERTVGTYKESLPTSCGPHRNRFLEVSAEICSWPATKKLCFQKIHRQNATWFYSTLLNLLRVKTRVRSYNLYATHFLSYPSQITLVKLIELKRTQTVCTEKERKRERETEKTERKQQFFPFFLKEINSQKKI